MKLQAKGLPDKQTVIYDGDCSFCKTWIARLSRWDRAKVLQFLPLQSNEALEVSGRTGEELGHAIHFVNPDGGMFTGALAVQQALLRTKWKIPAILMGSIPGSMFIAEKVYERVANSRYTLGCDGVTCKTNREEGNDD